MSFDSLVIATLPFNLVLSKQKKQFKTSFTSQSLSKLCFFFAFNKDSVYKMEIEVTSCQSPRKRHQIICIIFTVVVCAVVGFLIGYFVTKGSKDSTNKYQTDNGNTPKPNPFPDKDKYHRMFQDEIMAKNIEDNLR